MKTILASTLGGSAYVDGKWIPATLLEDNGMLELIKCEWKDNAKVLKFCSTPNDYDFNDSVYRCLKDAFTLSGLSVSSFEMCDDRNESVIEKLNEFDVLLLAGGHVPTENAFMKKLGLKERLESYNGLVIAWSAGSMNCASNVYATPELEGEAVDINYQRWMSGLGLTEVNIFPHYQMLKNVILDGYRMMEDIVYKDSMGHEIVVLNDGSYIVVADDGTTLYGEAYKVKDGCITQICSNGERLVLN